MVTVHQGFDTYKDLPNFPNIAGSSSIYASNTELCGTCWQLSLGSTSVVVTLISGAGVDADFTIGSETTNQLTGGDGLNDRELLSGAQQVDPSLCGL